MLNLILMANLLSHIPKIQQWLECNGMKPDGTIISRRKNILFWEGLMPTFKPDFFKEDMSKRAVTVPNFVETLSHRDFLQKNITNL